MLVISKKKKHSAQRYDFWPKKKNTISDQIRERWGAVSHRRGDNNAQRPNTPPPGTDDRFETEHTEEEETFLLPSTFSGVRGGEPRWHRSTLTTHRKLLPPNYEWHGYVMS